MRGGVAGTGGVAIKLFSVCLATARANTVVLLSRVAWQSNQSCFE